MYMKYYLSMLLYSGLLKLELQFGVPIYFVVTFTMNDAIKFFDSYTATDVDLLHNKMPL